MEFETTGNEPAAANFMAKPEICFRVVHLASLLLTLFVWHGHAAAQHDGFALDTIFNQQHLAESGVSICQRANELPDQQAFEFLRDWVVPGDHRSHFRVTTDFVAATHEVSRDSVTERGEARIISPATELIRLATKLKQTKSLRDAVERYPAVSASQQCDQTALLVLLSIADDDLATAAGLLENLLRSAIENRNLLDQAGQAVLLCADAAKDSQELRRIAVEIMPAMTEHYRTEYTRPAWLRHLVAISADLRQISATTDTEKTNLSQQWHRVSRSTALEHGSGFPSARWQLVKGSARSLSSYGDDFLFFASPLAGNFDIEAEATGFGYREAHLMVGGIWHGLVYDHKHYAVGNVRGESNRFPLSSPLSKTDSHGFIHTRIVRRDGVVRTYFSGRQIVEQPILDDADPWVAIRSMYRVHGGVDNLRISGSPTIPDSISMVDSSELLGWYDYFQVPDSDAPRLGDWQAKVFVDGSGNRVSEVNHPRSHALAPGSHAERLLVYTRPMLEDGTIEYEFWYSPESVIAHPAVGRDCFLLAADGVTLHKLTDGLYERSSLRPDNMAVVQPQSPSEQSPTAQGLNLKPEAWNSMRLELKADELTLVLNDETIHRQTVNANLNHRTFGLFHYADQSELRVRNATWTGDWPKQFPELEDQQLAASEHAFLDQTAADLPEQFTHDFGVTSLLSGKFTAVEGDPTSDVRATADGVVVSRTGRNGYSGTMLAPMIRVGGDFDATITFDQFECQTEAGMIGSVRFHVSAANELQDTALIQRLDDREHQQAVQCLKMEVIKGTDRRHYFGSRPLDGTAGRMRLCRRGNKVYYLIAENDSTQFQYLGQEDFTADDLTDSGIRFGVQIQGPGHSQVRIKRLEIRGERMSGQATEDSDALLAKLNAEREKLPISFTQNFATEAPSEANFFRWTDLNPWRADAGGLLIDAPGANQWGSSGLSLHNEYSGDFDISFSFKPIKLVVPQARKHTQVFLQIELNDRDRTQFSTILTKTSDDALVSQAQLRTRKDGKYDYQTLGTIGLDEPDYLRIARRKDELFFIAGIESDRSAFLIASAKISAAPIRNQGVRMLLHTGHVSGNSQILAKAVDLRAQSEKPVIISPVLPAQRNESLPARLLRNVQDLFQ